MKKRTFKTRILKKPKVSSKQLFDEQELGLKTVIRIGLIMIGILIIWCAIVIK